MRAGVKWKVMRWAWLWNVSRVSIDWRTRVFPFSPSSSWVPQSFATKRTTPSDMWVLRLSHTISHDAVRGFEANNCPGRHEIGLGAAITDDGDDLAGSGVERRDQGFRAMADIFEFPPFDVPRASLVRLAAARSSA